MTQTVDRALAAASALGASDVHLKVGLPPIFRIKGELRTVRELQALNREELVDLALRIMNDKQRADFEQNLDVDLAYSPPQGARFRVNLFQQRGSLGMVLRLIPPEVPPFETLHLPSSVLELVAHRRGVVLVTGATGSGKSTTLAALIDSVNQRHARHIVTIEDPIEYTFRDKRSVVNQREIGFDTMSFARALRAALRQDPDVILVGEMRDAETAQIAITAAETGHLVISTLHTTDATATMTRIFDAFPDEQQDYIAAQLSNCLRGVICQHLLPRADEAGRVLATEILTLNSAMGRCIRDRRFAQMPGLIQIGAQDGMHTIDDSLLHLLVNDFILLDDALAHCRDKNFIRENFHKVMKERFKEQKGKK